MHRDPTLRKRNALVIPGVLLVLICLAGIIYAQVLRSDEGPCEDGRMIELGGACRSVTLLLVLPLVLGLVLIVVGARARSSTTCHIGHGTIATTGLAVLIAAVVLPALAAVGLYLLQDPEDPYVVTYGDVELGLPMVVGAVAAVAGLALLPYLILYVATRGPRACCRERSCFEPCFCDEDAAPPIPTFPETTAAPMPAPLPPLPPPADNAQVTTAPWKGPTHVQPLPPPPPKLPPAPPKEDKPKPLMHDMWPEHVPPVPLDAAPKPDAPEPTPAWIEESAAGAAEPETPAKEHGKEHKEHGKGHKKAATKKTRKVAGKKR